MKTVLVPRGRLDVTLQQKKRRELKELKTALLRAVDEHGHKYNCSAARGMESDCHCGWLEVRELAKTLRPKSTQTSRSDGKA